MHNFVLLTGSFVSVELEASELHSTQSPVKVYTPLQTCSPKFPVISETLESPSTAPLQIHEEISVETTIENTPVDTPITTGANHQEHTTENIRTTTLTNPEQETTPTGDMESSYANISREIVESFMDSETAQAFSSHYSQYLPPGTGSGLEHAMTNVTEQNVPPHNELPELSPADGGNFSNVVIRDAAHSSINITRREILALTRVLERIPQEYVLNEETREGQALTLTIVNDTETAPNVASSSLEEIGQPVSSDVYPDELQGGHSMGRGKRRRPKYSLTGAMLKKHPFLGFSATGPIDKDKTPHKWWCRVCRVELSLMSRGSLELLSHYKTESHLVKEHRMRMEIPGMALFDREGRKIYGISLQEAKKKAKNNYPIAPQLDVCRPLVGQETVPDFNAVTSPTDKVLSQICILEHGLRHGGHIRSLTGIYDELSRLSSSSGICEQNWSPQRLFVSSSFSIDSIHFLSEPNFLHRNPFSISLFTVSKEHFVCLIGNFRLHVPRIGRILCHCDRCIWPLLFRFATYPNSNVSNPQLLVGERITARMLGKWTTGNVDAKENPDDSFIIHQSL